MNIQQMPTVDELNEIQVIVNEHSMETLLEQPIQKGRVANHRRDTSPQSNVPKRAGTWLEAALLPDWRRVVCDA